MHGRHERREKRELISSFELYRKGRCRDKAFPSIGSSAVLSFELLSWSSILPRSRRQHKQDGKYCTHRSLISLASLVYLSHLSQQDSLSTFIIIRTRCHTRLSRPDRPLSICSSTFGAEPLAKAGDVDVIFSAEECHRFFSSPRLPPSKCTDRGAAQYQESKLDSGTRMR